MTACALLARHSSLPSRSASASFLSAAHSAAGNMSSSVSAVVIGKLGGPSTCAHHELAS